MQNRNIEKVIVVFKTHLDIGFTDMAENVLKQYRDAFIPAAVELAFQVNTPKHKRFVWTVGSYLIQHYLNKASMPQKARLEDAIHLGYVCWHGLPLTTHTELMDTALIEYGLSISKKLDACFNRNTIAAKMTDVPGHTIAMVPLLVESGLEFLHLGVNAASRVPEVPSLFRWRFGGQELIVNYATDYGDATVLNNGVAMEICHTHDNAGPPSEAALERIYRELAMKYPGAVIEAGTLDDFALALRDVRDDLPVVEEEIGDTWIHGIATDPIKVSQFKRLLKLREKWVESDVLTLKNEAYDAFMEPLLMVAEHTWGLDCKKHLMDFTHWKKDDFATSRQKDVTSYEDFSPFNHHLSEPFKATLPIGWGEGKYSYSLFEASHAEQRNYINQAIDSLPSSLAQQAKQELHYCVPTQNARADTFFPGEAFMVGEWQVTVDKDGAISHLANFDVQINRDVRFGLFEYQTFGGKTVDDYYYEYCRELDKNSYWAEFDFGKPGIRYETSLKNACFRAVPVRIETKGNLLKIFLKGDYEACTTYGCPRDIIISHRFERYAIYTDIYWQNKDALRSPEAVWLHFNLRVANPNRWLCRTLGQEVSPLNVVSGGNRKLHCVQELCYTAADGEIVIVPHDAPLVAMGAKSLYNADNRFDNLENGFYFLLYNNQWGTNFKQWFDEDMRFSFDTLIRNSNFAASAPRPLPDT